MADTPTVGEIVRRLEGIEKDFVREAIFGASLVNVGDRLKDLQSDVADAITSMKAVEMRVASNERELNARLAGMDHDFRERLDQVEKDRRSEQASNRRLLFTSIFSPVVTGVAVYVLTQWGAP